MPSVPLRRKDKYTDTGDFYPTPAAFTRVRLRNIALPPGPIWECACGTGEMAKVLEESNHPVLRSDKHKYGQTQVFDFLDCQPPWPFASIVTNPPFFLGLEFVLTGLEFLKTTQAKKLALLLPVHFLGSEIRLKKIYRPHPPSQIVLISNRMNIGQSSSNFNHAWFVWEKSVSETFLMWDLAV